MQVLAKNFLCFKIISFVLILALSGCGGGGSGAISNTPSDTSAPFLSSSSATSTVFSSSSLSSDSIVSVISSSNASLNSSLSVDSSVNSSQTSSSAIRNINSRLQAEQNDRSFGVSYVANDGETNNFHVSEIDPEDYIEWDIYAETSGTYKITTRFASQTLSSFQILIDGGEVAELGLPVTGLLNNWQSVDSTSFNIPKGQHSLRIKFTSGVQALDWVQLNASPIVTNPEIELGLWRLVSRGNRFTLTKDQSSGKLIESQYSGNVSQQWRAKKIGEAYQFVLEKSGECLTPLNAKGLAACERIGLWVPELLRASSEDRPAIYRFRSIYGECLVINPSFGVGTGACDEKARWYFEPVGYGERLKPVEYEVKSLLLIKEFTSVAGISSARIPSDIISAARESYEKDVANWFKRMTDGRVSWKAETIISPNPITSFTVSDNIYLPAAVNLADDIQQFVPIGKYDTVTVFFTGGSVSGGWGWGPGSSKESNYTLWATVNGGSTPAAQWISGANEPTEVFIHEPMHGFDAHFDRFQLALPEGYLHGAEENNYQSEIDGWMPWYRDYWLGTVIASDDTYRGYGPRMFRKETVRSYALKAATLQ